MDSNYGKTLFIQPMKFYLLEGGLYYQIVSVFKNYVVSNDMEKRNA